MNRKIVAVWVSLFIMFGFIVIIVNIAPIVEAPTTLYVGGSNPGNYSKIQDAINNADSGDIVYVYEGHYYENVVVNKSISLTGEDIDTTIIDGFTTGDVVRIETNSVNMNGFSVWNSGIIDESGIVLDSAWYCNVFDNRILSNQYGIKLTYSSNNNISNNYITDNWQGIYVQQFGNNNITGNTIIFNRYLGIHLRYSSTNYLAGNDIQSNEYGGIRLISSSNNHITGNIFINNYDGIEIFPSSDNNNIINNEFSEHGNFGIMIDSSSYNNIKGNEFKNDELGIIDYNTDGNTITDNSFTPNSLVGIMLLSSTDSKISNNTMVESGIYLWGDILEHWNTHDIDTENTVNGKPVFYWKDRSEGIMDMCAGQVILANCNNIKVQNQEIASTSVGIIMGFSSNCNISVNSISSNIIGLYLVYSSENTLTCNNFSLNDNGVYIEKDSDSNLIYHNNFIDNTNQSYDNCTNDWDNGYPSGGNYWSNYTGLDEYSGPDQDQQGSDGIGDTPYYFEQSSQDNYPLIEPWVLEDFPTIVSTSPPYGTTDVGTDTEIVIEFSEPMNTESVESAISIMPYNDYSFSWSNENKNLTITFSEPLDYMTQYQITIDTGAEDLAGNRLEEPYEILFTTKGKPKEEVLPVFYLLLILLFIIVAVIMVSLILAKRKKSPEEMTQPQMETPQAIQVTCPNCNKLLQVNDTGFTQNVSCPFCSTVLTIQSRHPQPHMVQPQPQILTMKISCPKCRFVFEINKTGGLTRVQCPNCRVTGTINT